MKPLPTWMPPPTHDVYSTEQWSRIKLQYTIFIDADHGPGAEIEAGTSPGWCVRGRRCQSTPTLRGRYVEHTTPHAAEKCGLAVHVVCF